jgi:GH25 family lysozyme M1 (1,4-beta-N-acetylmuramidase)
MAQSTRSRTKSRRRKKKSTTTPILIVLLALMMLGLLLFRMLLQRTGAEVPEITQAPSPTVTETLPPTGLTADHFGMENGYKFYASDAYTSRLGLDVSSHQGWIDWSAVAESGVDFVMIRAGYRGYSEGELNTDEYFYYNIESALENGLDVGIYYFSQAMSEEEAAQEAQAVLDLVDGYNLTYPIYFDWETIDEGAARTDTISGSELTRYAKVFCDTIQDAGYTAGVYFNLSMAAHLYQLYQLKDYAFWLAEYQDTPSFPFAVAMWQYTSQGEVPGITGTVDLNLLFVPT